MPNLITSAIPTDNAAKQFLSDHPELHNHTAITPLTAQKLYEKNIITNNRNFLCPTKDCIAPITCRSISKNSLNSPTFVNQSIAINKHIESCKYHPNSPEELDKTSTSSRFKHMKTGKIISDLSISHGFEPKNSSSTTSTNKVEESNDSSTSKKGGRTLKNRKKRSVNSHLKTLQDHVEAYKFDKDFPINKQNPDRTIPIKDMFRHISKNIFAEELQNQNYPYIYYGNAFLNETKNIHVLRLSFKSHRYYPQDDQTKYYPSLLVSKEFIENEFTEIYDAFINKNETTYRVYTTLPLLWIRNADNDLWYLNFSSLKSAEKVDPFSTELYHNIFIS